MRFGVLGPVELRDGQRRLPAGSPQQRALLAVLLLNANRVVSVDRLVDHLWGDPPPATARGLLQGCVAGLRRTLRETGQDPVRAAGLLAEALALWREPALDGIDLDSCQPGVTRLAERRLAVLAQRIDLDLRLDRHAELVGELGTR
jgi:DNA-binding SARP family transcriptional activator